MQGVSQQPFTASGEKELNSNEKCAENPHTLKGGPGAWEHIVFGTDQAPSGLESNIERFQKMLDANKISDSDRTKMWGLTTAGILGVDPKTRRLIPKTN